MNLTQALQALKHGYTIIHELCPTTWIKTEGGTTFNSEGHRVFPDDWKHDPELQDGWRLATFKDVPKPVHIEY